jgi:hypothetical protein
MPYPMFHMPLTHLFITSEDPPKLKLDLVVYTDAGKKITLQSDPPKTYNDHTIIHYKVDDDIPASAGYFYHQFEFTCIGKPHIVETIIDGTSRHTVINSSDRAEPI